MAEIYALRDPATNEVRYIGKANDSMKRLKTHIRDSRRRNTPVYSWIKKLASKGLVPTVEVLEVADSWEEAERNQIKAHRDCGCRLLNLAEGGNQPGQASYETLAANGRKAAAKIHGDPFSKRLWEIKRALGFALKRGELRPHIIEAMRTAATKRPDLFGCWAGITVPENQTAV